eukprot:UN13164
MGNQTTVSRTIPAISNRSSYGNESNDTIEDKIDQHPDELKNVNEYKYKYEDEGAMPEHNCNSNNSANSDNDSNHEDDQIIHSVTLMGYHQNEELHIQNLNKNNNIATDNEMIENEDINNNANEVNAQEYGWWSYTFNAKNKYIIHIQFKMKGRENLTKYRPGVFKKYGAKCCTINGKHADIVSFTNCHKKMSDNSNSYDNNEYVILKIDNNINRLFFVKRIGWCFDDGAGIYINVKRIVCGKLPDINND